MILLLIIMRATPCSTNFKKNNDDFDQIVCKHAFMFDYTQRAIQRHTLADIRANLDSTEKKLFSIK